MRSTRLANETALRAAKGTLAEIEAVVPPEARKAVYAALVRGLVVGIESYLARFEHERERLVPRGTND